MAKERDGRLDCIKGIAISLVIIGHILQICYEDYSSTFLYNIIWTLQIPLFVIVSGYFAGGGITVARLVKKIRYYLIPFCSCWLICELFIRGNTNLLDRAEYLAYHLESSLWYLFVLFVLSLVHMLASTITTALCKARIDNIKRLIVYTIAYGVCLLPFAGLAILMGTSFLGCKFVLYYSLFYWVGFAWRTLTEIVTGKPELTKSLIRKVLNAIVVVAFIAYCGILSRFNIAEAGDGLIEIVIRFVASICGILLICKTVYGVYKENGVCCKFLSYIGNYTLEIYYIHYMFIGFVGSIVYPLASPMGMISIVFLYFTVLALCAGGIMLTKSSPYLSLLLFGRSRK